MLHMTDMLFEIVSGCRFFSSIFQAKLVFLFNVMKVYHFPEPFSVMGHFFLYLSVVKEGLIQFPYITILGVF